jgi:hypothetical protein
MHNVTPLVVGQREDPAHDHWRRRQALVLVAQLPDDDGDARKIIAHMLSLIDTFLTPPPT